MKYPFFAHPIYNINIQLSMILNYCITILNIDGGVQIEWKTMTSSPFPPPFLPFLTGHKQGCLCFNQNKDFQLNHTPLTRLW